MYTNSDVAKSYGYTNDHEQIGVIAQEVEAVLPQAVTLAPFDTYYIEGIQMSKSGENYKTVQYDKIIPLLIEAMKEQNVVIEDLVQSIINIKKELM